MEPSDAQGRAVERADGERPGPPAGRRLDAHLLEYVRDSALWPVLIVAVAIFVTLGTALLLAALRLRNLFAMAALAILVVVSLDLVWRDVRQRRFGPTSGAVLGLWVLCAVASAIAVVRGWA